MLQKIRCSLILLLALCAVSSYAQTRRFRVDFGNVNTNASGWNNVGYVAEGGTVSLIDTDGTSSALNFQVVNVQGTNVLINNNGYNGTVLDYPASACNDSHYTQNEGNTYRLNNLDVAKLYDIRIFASRTSVGNNRIGIYTINGQQQSLEAANNTSQTILFTDVSPNASGIITITMELGPSSAYAYLNVLDVTEKTVTTSLSAPTNLTAQLSGTNVQLNWTGVAGEDGYRIERKLSSGSVYTQVGQVGVDVVQYTDATSAAGNTYDYRVYAYTSTQQSGYSNVANIQVPSPLNAPTNLTAQLSGTNVQLNWTGVAGEDGYRIERKLSSGSVYTQVAQVGVDVVQYTDATSAAGNTYDYRVYAYTSTQQSGYSNVANIQVPSSLSAPTNLTAQLSGTNVQLNWTGVAGEDGYRIERKLSSGSVYTQVGQVGVDVVQYTDATSAAGNTYDYRVYAYTSTQQSGYSNVANIQVPSSLSAPTNLTAQLSGTNVQLNWTGVAGEDGYRIERKLSSGSVFTQVAQVGADITSYTDASTTTGNNYDYRVYAFTSSAQSGYSNVASILVPAPSQPDRRILVDFGNTATSQSGWNSVGVVNVGSSTSLIDTNGGSTGISLTYVSAPWASIQLNGTGYNGTVLDYPASASQDSHYTQGSGSTYRINGLDNTKTYDIRIFASRTSVADQRIGIYTINGQQQSLNAANNTSQTILFQDIVPNASNQITIAITLGASSAYAYLNVLDVVEKSASIILPAPTNLTSQLTGSDVQLNWTDVSGEDGYRIERKLSSATTYIQIGQVSADVSQYVDASATPWNTYDYRVYAYSSNQQSAYSNTASLGVVPDTGDRRFLIDFGNPANTTTLTGWNNVTDVINGTSVSLVDNDGNSAGISLVVVNQPSNGYDPTGGDHNTQGYVGQLLDYPQSACEDSHYAYQAGGSYQIAGLNDAATYDIRIFASRNGVADTRVASYTINGQQQTFDGANNTSTLVTFTGITPVGGVITIAFQAGAGSTFGYLNVLDMVEHTLVDPVPDQVIPSPFRITRDGRKPEPDFTYKFKTDLEAIQQDDVELVFTNCEAGVYYVAFQMEYDLGDNNTTIDWTSTLDITLLDDSNNEVWTKSITLSMTDQTFLGTVFHDAALTCSDNYSLRITTKDNSGSVPQGNIYLSTLLFKQETQEFDPATQVQLNCSYNNTNGETSLGWTTSGVNITEYDLEWVFIEEHEGFTGNTPFDAFAAKEPVRITTAETTYDMLTYYPDGILAFRIRAVGYNLEYPDHRIPGQWQYSSCGLIPITNHEPDKNWLEQTVFAEDGKYKKVMSYFDGSLRQRQSLTNLNTEQVTLVGESYVDFEGRPSINILPVPMASNSLRYQNNFNQFQSQDAEVTNYTSATKVKYHYDNASEENSIISNASGAGKYYSPANDLNSVLKDYIPDAAGYVYSQVEYVNDGTGRPKKQSGVGEAFRTDGQHATYYFYGNPTPEELIRLFGSNVGNAKHYKKNLVVDPNVQASVSYMDQEGRVIATALAGEKPDNVDALKSYTDLPDDLVSSNIIRNNTKEANVSKTVFKILNVAPTSYNFHYDVAALASEVEELGCVDCTFDLTISITDPAGNLIPLSGMPGSEGPDDSLYHRNNITAYDCEIPTVVNDVNFDTIFASFGDYTITKTLTAKELSFPQMKERVQSDPQVQQEIQTIVNSFTPDLTNCEICQEEACLEPNAIEELIEEIAELDCQNIYNRIVGELTTDTHDPTAAEIKDHPDFCQYQLCMKNKASDVFDKQMARIPNWTSAVAAYGGNPYNYDPFFKGNLSGNEFLVTLAMPGYLDNISLGKVPLVTVFGTIYPVMKGSIGQVTDPNNTDFYVNDEGYKDTNGYHILYYELMRSQNRLGSEVYQEKLNEQRWILYRSFYEEAKRKGKLLSEYKDCEPAKRELQRSEGLPTTKDEMNTWIEANEFREEVSDEELDMLYFTISETCNADISELDSAAIYGNLQAYLTDSRENLFKRIISEDIDTHPALIDITNILGGYNCSLDPIALNNPFVCLRDTTIVIRTDTLGTGGGGGGPILGEPGGIHTYYKYWDPYDILDCNCNNIDIQSNIIGSACGQSNGAVSLNLTGGSGNYSFRWTNNSGTLLSTTNEIVGQPSGRYQLIINDYAQPCIMILYFEIPLNDMSISGIVNDNSACTLANGSIDITVSGGSGNYHYSWFTGESGSISNLEDISGLKAQTYDVLVTDVNTNCFVRKEFVVGVDNINPIIVTVEQITPHTSCSPDNGGINISSIGGSGQYNYLWTGPNNFTVSQNPSNISAGIYYLTVTDRISGCIASDVINVPEMVSYPEYQLATTPNTMCGPVSNGTAKFNVTSANPYQIVWSYDEIPGDSVSQLSYGEYTFTIRDQITNCTVDGYAVIEDDSYGLKVSEDILCLSTEQIGTTVTDVLIKLDVDNNGGPYSVTWQIGVNEGASITITEQDSLIVHPGSYYGIFLTVEGPCTPPAQDSTLTFCVEYDLSDSTLSRFGPQVDWDVVVERCIYNANLENDIITQRAIDAYLENRVSYLYDTLRTSCIAGVTENLIYSYVPKEHHYTLYYYDQAGNLEQTVPPAGVHPLSDSQVTDFLMGNITEPGHKLITKYQYTSFNQLLWQQTPDAGESQFWYDDKGRLKLSQNAQQALEGHYSYTKYDDQGRIREVGEMETTQPLATLLALISDPHFPNDQSPMPSDYVLYDITRTHYDFANPNIQAEFPQDNLRTRVAWVEVLDKDKTDTTATYYSYDIHGNVKSLLQQQPDLDKKRTDYAYDLISGNVNYVLYQYDQPDQFIHGYTYDADNRIQEVSTSSDGFVWNREADYSYYSHGPLARTVLGQYTVQGMDYYYTLQGWLKGTNMPYAGDLSEDGLNGSLVGKDAFAYTLGYYEGDYTPITPSVTRADGRDQLWQRFRENIDSDGTGLYNGNISWMITDLAKIGENNNDRTQGMQAMLYQYDQLHRIRKARSLTSYNASTGFASRAASPAPYDVDYTYDPNGNLLTLQRRDHQAGMMNDFTYGYYNNTNKLREVIPVTIDTAYTSGPITFTKNKVYRNITLDGSAYVPAGADVTLYASENIIADENFLVEDGADFYAHVLGDNEGTYQYDAIGNLVLNLDEGVKIEWTVYGKVREVRTRHDSVIVSFRYDAAGNRIEKRLRTLANDGTGWSEGLTQYVRDASGNVMTTYFSSPSPSGEGRGEVTTEQSIYGSTRLGMYKGNVANGSRTLGFRDYELSNHLGNVLAGIKDNIERDGNAVDAVTRFTMDYYPFGLEMEGRTWKDGLGYRYGFNGKEKDDKTEWGNVAYDYGFRIYDPEIAKFLSVDPLTREFPWNGTYVFAENDVIRSIDLEGAEKYVSTFAYGVSDGKPVLAVISNDYKQPEGTSNLYYSLFDGPMTPEEIVANGFIRANNLPTNGSFRFFVYSPEYGLPNSASYEYTDASGMQQVKNFDGCYVDAMYQHFEMEQQTAQKILIVGGATLNALVARSLLKAQLNAVSTSTIASAEIITAKNLNLNSATGNFGIYKIEIDGTLYKFGKADLGRVTKSSGLPTRVHQQVRILREEHPNSNVRAKVVEDLGTISTEGAKAVETNYLQQYFDRTGIIPEGNLKSFKPKKH